ncbi:MAG: amidohydrolase family protein [Ilumatobacteraceae bacterium]
MTSTACDTHMHVYDDRYPVAPAAVLRPPNASVADYREVQAEIGTTRVVVVQPTTYGLDNRCQLEAMAAFDDAARGVMVVDAATTREDLARLTELGVRGARFHMLPGGAVPWEQLEPVADAIAPFGWHVQLQLDGRELPARMERLLALPVSLVIDHVGRFMPAVDPDSAAFAALVTLVDQGARVKLSAPYESSADGPPGFADIAELVDALVARAPDRMLWASNWPHPGQGAPPSPTELVALRDRWLPTPELRRQVLAENPTDLYDF